MHLETERGERSSYPRHETRRRDDVQSDGSQAHCRCTLPLLWRCLGAVSEDAVLPAVICCDTAFVSFRGGGRCQVEHERFTLCYSHSIDGHSGPWQTCQQ